MPKTTKKGLTIIEHMLDGPLREQRRRRILADAFEANLRDGYRQYFLALHNAEGQLTEREHG